ncbi:MAG: hypothetical protein AB8G99_17375 [Planctomycetaceae bacterium]
MKSAKCFLILCSLVLSANTAEAGIFGFLKPRSAGVQIAEGCCATPCSACTPKFETVKVTKTCYKPKRVPICVPPIKFPWMKCNEFGRPKIRCVNRFEKEEIDCGEKCVVVWELDEELAKDYCKCNTGGCYKGGCGTCGGIGCATGCGECGQSLSTAGCADPGGCTIVR